MYHTRLAIIIASQTDGQTDRRQYHANSGSYCTQYDRLKISCLYNLQRDCILYHIAYRGYSA